MKSVEYKFLINFFKILPTFEKGCISFQTKSDNLSAKAEVGAAYLVSEVSLFRLVVLISSILQFSIRSGIQHEKKLFDQVSLLSYSEIFCNFLYSKYNFFCRKSFYVNSIS